MEDRTGKKVPLRQFLCRHPEKDIMVHQTWFSNSFAKCRMCGFVGYDTPHKVDAVRALRMRAGDVTGIAR